MGPPAFFGIIPDFSGGGWNSPVTNQPAWVAGNGRAQCTHLISDQYSTLFASAGHDDKTVRLWDAANGEVVSTLRGNAAVEGVAFSPDSKILATFETAIDANGESIASPDSGFHFFGAR